jgi:rod shape-determining protein MreC
MDFFLSRYRNLTVLLIVIVAQLLLIAYQVKSHQDVALIRVWAVTAVTPVEQALEFVRRYSWGFVEDYFVLLGVRIQNEKLKNENGQLKLENHYLKSELTTADRARALSVFQAHSPSKTVAVRVIGNGTGANSKVVFVDRGSTSGIESGMAVVTPDGIVGKVVDAYPTASLVMLITDPTFAAGVVSQNNRVRGTLKGLGQTKCLVDYAQNEEKVDEGEWFYTSGDDRIFPRGFPVGQVTSVHNGKTFKEIYVTPIGMQGGVEEVLIMLQGQHLQIPNGEVAAPGYKILPSPPESATDVPQPTGKSTVLTTDADRLRQQYKQSGDAQHHVFGEGTPGSTPPDFTKIQGIRAASPANPSAIVPKQGSVTPVPAQPQRPATPGGPAGNSTAPSATPVTAPPVTRAGGPSINPATDPSITPAPPKAKPRPTAPILVTDPTDADPDAVPPPAPKTEKPSKPPGAPPARPPNQ